jgi:hypothetical protein
MKLPDCGLHGEDANNAEAFQLLKSSLQQRHGIEQEVPCKQPEDEQRPAEEPPVSQPIEAPPRGEIMEVAYAYLGTEV